MSNTKHDPYYVNLATCTLNKALSNLTVAQAYLADAGLPGHAQQFKSGWAIQSIDALTARLITP
jgi:hypothetical protein